jgi:hypothetical protein
VLKYTCLESYGIYTQKPGSTSIRGQKLSRTHCNSWCIYVPLFTDLKQAKINLFDWPLVKYTYKHRMKCTLSIWNGVPYWSVSFNGSSLYAHWLSEYIGKLARSCLGNKNKSSLLNNRSKAGSIITINFVIFIKVG